MPWKEFSVMDERLRFIARLLEGEPMTDVCRAFGISRKTGYKLFARHKDDGPVALADRSRRRVGYANQLPEQIETLIVRSKREKPHWGARKIRELLVRRLAAAHSRAANAPAPSSRHRAGRPSAPLPQAAISICSAWKSQCQGRRRLDAPSVHLSLESAPPPA